MEFTKITEGQRCHRFVVPIWPSLLLYHLRFLHSAAEATQIPVRLPSKVGQSLIACSKLLLLLQAVQPKQSTRVPLSRQSKSTGTDEGNLSRHLTDANLKALQRLLMAMTINDDLICMMNDCLVLPES